MASLMERIIKNSNSKEATRLSDADYLTANYIIPTQIPILNAAFSGSLFGGFEPGITMIAGESKTFKTSMALIAAKAFLDKHEDGIVLFLDCEFGSRRQMLQNVGIDIERVAHIPFTNLEELKQETVQQLKQLNKEDNVFVLVDSIGNTASLKEVTDAEEGNTTADMTRAKQLRSYFRMITPTINLKKIPFFGINHTYNSIGFIPKQEMGGGGGPMYASDTVIFVTKAQMKDGSEKIGNQFNLKIEKSRSLKEGSKLPISVSFKEGVLPWSGLFEMASEGGFITMPTKGFYQVEGYGEKKYRKKDMNDADFWTPLLENPEFDQFIQNKLLLSDLSLQTNKEEALDAYNKAEVEAIHIEEDGEEEETDDNDTY